MTAAPPLQTEVTPIGEQSAHREKLSQSFSETGSLPGVTPITPLDRLSLRAAAPLRSAKAQKPANHGMFDLNARDQIDLFAKAGA